MINARVDVFLGPFLAGAGPGTQEELFPRRCGARNAYLEAGVDCVYPSPLGGRRVCVAFTSEVGGPVNVDTPAQEGRRRSPSLPRWAWPG